MRCVGNMGDPILCMSVGDRATSSEEGLTGGSVSSISGSTAKPWKESKNTRLVSTRRDYPTSTASTNML